ncbi:ATP-binding protein [Streptomyces sp. NPDC090022]|uniref:ATP-binding protein n=1 Tax=Streptomyces sp. NPDC090022 TaxID=3365920 RepID=UPI00380EA99C
MVRTTAVVQVVAELAANAATHGRVPGRGFRVAVTELPEVFLVEVCDPRGEKRPFLRAEGAHEGGYGMRLVDALASDWGVYGATVGKVVWATVPKRPASGLVAGLRAATDRRLTEDERVLLDTVRAVDRAGAALVTRAAAAVSDPNGAR